MSTIRSSQHAGVPTLGTRFARPRRDGLVLRTSPAEITGVVLLISSFTWSAASIEEHVASGATALQVATRVVPVLLCASWLLARDARMGYRAVRGLLRWPALPVLWYALIGSASGLGSPLPLLSLWKGCELAVLAYWSSHVRITCNDRGDSERVLRTLMFAVAGVLVYVLVAALIDPEAGFRPSGGLIPVWLSSSFPHINANGLGVLSALCLYAFISGNVRFENRWLHGAILCIATATLVTAQSRTAYVGLAVALLVSLVARAVLRTSRRDLLRLALVLTIAGGALAAHETVLELLTRSQDLEGLATLSGRTSIWEVALDAIQAHPLAGGGHAVYSRGLFVDYPGVFRNDLVNIHNAPLEAMLGAGVLGALPLVLAYLSLPAWGIARIVARKEAALPLAGGIGIILVIRMSTSIAPALLSVSSVLFLAALAGVAARARDRRAHPGAS